MKFHDQAPSSEVFYDADCAIGLRSAARLSGFLRAADFTGYYCKLLTLQPATD